VTGVVEISCGICYLKERQVERIAPRRRLLAICFLLLGRTHARSKSCLFKEALLYLGSKLCMRILTGKLTLLTYFQSSATPLFCNLLNNFDFARNVWINYAEKNEFTVN